MDLLKLRQILDEVSFKVRSDFEATTIGCHVVDCVLLHVAVRREPAQHYSEELIVVLKTMGLHQQFFDNDLLRYSDLAKAMMPDGKNVTQEIEEEVLRLFAVGKFLQWWDIVPPEDMGAPSSARGSYAQQGGLVAISDFQLAAFE